MAGWLRAPHVAAWWPDRNDLASVEAHYLPMIDGSDTTEGFVLVTDHGPIGFIQRYQLDDEPEWKATIERALGPCRSAGIDYFIGDPASIGKGLGAEAIGSFVELTWSRYADVATVVVAVQQENLASWRALERAGFQRAWSGLLDTDDPSDRGPAYGYTRTRPGLSP
jgi:aminoglycoside 6'-N-acetyltransferase